MKLEIGKEYVTRSGGKVKIYDIAKGGVFPVIAGVIRGNEVTPTSYTINGTYLCGREEHFDIVGEWQEPLEFDWSCLPAWANKYIAMDRNGDWFTYSDEPSHNGEQWYFGGKLCEIPKEYTPKNFKGSWENSLFKNPNKS